MTQVPSTIFALSSGTGRAGVAVVRVSGPGASVAVTTLIGGLPKPRHAALRWLRGQDGRLLDSGLVLWFPGPKSETGEDLAEFQIHGGRAVLAALYRELGALPGFRLAEPGEFARRAFANGKLDLTGVEGLADLIDAETEAQRRQAVRQAAGHLDELYGGYRDALLAAMGLIEAAIDFSDEADVSQQAVEEGAMRVRVLLDQIKLHLGGADRGEIVRDGFRVVLVGRPNVGKSSLLNALARRDVAIVSDEAGTTRDVIEVRLDLGGYPVIISDTAGLRDASGAVEQEGMRRTLVRAGAAHLVLLVSDGGELPPELDPGVGAVVGEARSVLRVRNKSDLLSDAPASDWDHVVSAHTGAGLQGLVDAIALRCRAATDSGGADQSDGMVPTNVRHRLLLGTVREHLEAFLSSADQPIEVRADELRLAAQALGRLTGRIDPEDVLGAIFGRFCIGK